MVNDMTKGFFYIRMGTGLVNPIVVKQYSAECGECSC
ncbi:Uncharacterised protein [Yersinia mollaretii]|nr:Uncharacterised protein [Yersinia mollaretii]